MMCGMKVEILVAVVAACGTGWAQPVIDNSPTRVQTSLRVGMRPVGTLRSKAVGEVSASRWTVDCAGMDREHTDWRAVRDYIAPLGIPRMRQQAGWARCEKDPGKYDFAWLDQAVYEGKRLGVSTWLELSYGNPAYPGGGGRQLGAGMPSSKEGLAAWDRFVERIVTHYKGVITDFCIWNEPDLHGANDVGPATDFAIRTAEKIRAIVPDARISAFALSWANPGFIGPFAKELEKRGKAHLFNELAYHHYNFNPDAAYAESDQSRAILARHAPNMRMMEGEGGTQSEWGANGALCRLDWTELMQAKYDLRRSLGDLAHGDDTSVFHLCDLEYRTSGFHDGLVRYGLLKTAGQAEGYRVLKVKAAYYAIQNAVSVFNDAMECLGTNTTSTVKGLGCPFVCDWRDRRTGIPAVVFWDAMSPPRDGCETAEVELAVRGEPIPDPVWCDLLTGDVYAIDPRNQKILQSENQTIYRVPAYDSPAFVTSAKLLTLDKSWFVRFVDSYPAPQVAVFGGSFSVIAPSRIVKDAWRRLGCAVHDFGVNGAGFAFKSRGAGGTNSIPEQVARVAKSGRAFDVYVLWASTNDANSRTPEEQNAGIAECVRLIRESAPKAKIVFLSSPRIPLLPEKDAKIAKLVDAQAQACRELGKGIRYVDLYHGCGFSADNSGGCFQQDKLHMTERGYERIRDLAAWGVAKGLWAH